MKRKPSSKKKHKDLRRVRKADWEQSRRNMEKIEKEAEAHTEVFMKELFQPEVAHAYTRT